MNTINRLIPKIFLAASCSLISLNAVAQKVKEPTKTPKEWSVSYVPFRIVGNLYYVGTEDLASYLVTTPQGHILINTGLAASAATIRTNVEKLGFKFADIKILLATHAHFDHVGAMAKIKELTGAKMMIEEKDAQVLADGGNSDFALGGKGAMFKPVKADRLLKDRDTISLGDMRVVLLHHPGHTKGASSFLFDVKDGQKFYTVLIANMPTIISETNLSGMSTYPDVAKDYGYTLDAMKKLKFDIWLASHASQFNLAKKHKRGDVYNPEAFIDREGYDAKIDDLEKDYLKKLNGNK